MRKQLLALGLIATSGLFAAELPNEPSNQVADSGYCNSCCSYPCCCEPCCVPQPKKCIDCECYSPAFYDLQCDWGFSFDVAFLYWYAGETGLSYAASIFGQPPVPGSTEIFFAPSSYKYLGTDWEPGVRVGIGWNSECDGWDWNLNWTWMKNSRKDSSSKSTNGDDCNGVTKTSLGLLNPWFNQSFNAFNGTRLFDKISAKWRLTFNQIDLEIGRKYWSSRRFALRPYAAVRGAWWKTRFNLDSVALEELQGGLLTRNTCFRDKFTNDVWGVGFLGGLQPTWYFCCNFALYANFDVALLWGRFKAKKHECYNEVTTGGTIPDVINVGWRNNSKGEFSQMTAMLDTGIGLRWEETWCCDRYRTALDFGWEHHILFDQNHRMKTIDAFSPGQQENLGTFIQNANGFKTYDEATGNIGLGGFVLRLMFDF